MVSTLRSTQGGRAMAAKRLIVCCDGTWNNADSGDGFTNVARLSWAILPQDTRGGREIAQVVNYHSGVGSGDVVDRVAGETIGIGLSRNVRDAYAFIYNNYCPGDEIFLFGFSRGAYTVRSVGGLIGYAGLLHKRDMERFEVLWENYRLRDKPGHPDLRPQFANRHFPVAIKCIGVWDTVGSLGIPVDLDVLANFHDLKVVKGIQELASFKTLDDLKDFRSFYQFHDTRLGRHVERGLHALALDEARVDFQPTLWVQRPEAKAGGQVLKQVWFAGVHSSVGGGYDEHGLSDV